MEFIAVIFSLISVWLTARKNILCWSTGIIGIIAYSYIFYQKNEWSNFSLQFFFIIQSILGWMNWNRSKTNEVSNLETYERFSISIGTIVIFLCFYILNIILSGNLTILDAITSALSIFGMFLLSKSKIEAWIFWMFADVIYIYFFFLNKLYLSSGLYCIFLMLSIYGYFNWKKQLKK
jgi:nicotinamide mononucleotide transporter